MEILEIIPFNKSFKKDTLSYFSTKPVPVGSIVTIEIRKKESKGIVISKRKIKDQKSELKSQSFTLKKIKSVQKNTILKKETLEASQEVANYFATGTGAVINSVIPKFVLDNLNKIKKISSEEKKSPTADVAGKYVIQEPDVERFSSYKRLIREEFAKKRSVIFICPTIEDTKFAFENLTKGIEENSFIFHSKLSKPESIKRWNTVVQSNKSMLIIATGVYITIPVKNVGSIVIEKENARNYRSMQAPYLDYRIFAEIYAKKINARFFLSDLVLRLETLRKVEDHIFYEFMPIKYRNLTTADSKLIDMSKAKFSNGEKFNIFSEELETIIRKTHDENEYAFLMTSRRGLSPTIVCMDCGHTVSCSNCDSPMVLHGKDPAIETNFFLCHGCNEKRRAGELCKNCQGWRLKTLGIGSELVKKELEDRFSNLKIFIIDSDHTKTPNQAKKVIEDFYKNPGSILIGTEMALLYLHEQIENVGIVSIDSMFANPDFNINERILNTMLKIKSKATQNFIIQTRKADERIFNHIINGNIAEFIRIETKERETYDYPPFSLLIKIIISGSPKAVEKEFTHLREFLKEFELVEYPIIRESTKTKVTRGALIKFKRENWPNKELIEKLKLLPAYYKIVVDAENIF